MKINSTEVPSRDDEFLAWCVFHVRPQAISPHEPGDIVVVAGRRFTIESTVMRGAIYYGCGALPARRSRADLIKDIERSQGPEWRGETDGG